MWDRMLRERGQPPDFTQAGAFAQLALAVRKLFVGATRATMKLVLVVSERSARLLLGRLA